MTADPLSHRERVRLALARQETDRVPISLVCSGINDPNAVEAWLRAHRGVSLADFLHPLIDIRNITPPYIGPPTPQGTDFWGVKRSPVNFGAGYYQEISHYPLAEATGIDDLERHPWPTTNWFDYAALPALIAEANADAEYCFMASLMNPFETAWYMRGMEQTYMDMAMDPGFVEHLLNRVTGFLVEHTRRILEAADGTIDLVFTADDVGGQEGLLMSPAMWRQFIEPFHRRINAVVHEFGVKVIYHSDGAVMDLVPGFIDMGIDVLQALQFDAAGMDPVQLKTEHGDRLCFAGGISVQQTLPFGTPDAVREEVRERIRVLGRGGGYILGPSHAIQVGTPPENTVALFETAATTCPCQGGGDGLH